MTFNSQIFDSTIFETSDREVEVDWNELSWSDLGNGNFRVYKRHSITNEVVNSTDFVFSPSVQGDRPKSPHTELRQMLNQKAGLLY